MGTDDGDTTAGTPYDQGTLIRALDFVGGVDPVMVKASVAELRRQYPKASNDELAARIFSRARWKATAAGGLTGLPSNPWVMVPAALADVALTYRIEVGAAAQVALIYEPEFFADEDARWELFVPVFGMNVASQFLREVGVRGAMGVTRQAIKRYLSKQTLRVFRAVALKYFGLKVTQKVVVTKTLPVIGGLVGASWNFVEVSLLRRRCIRYFQNKSIGTSSGDAS